ncbi:hypothetical protein NMG60_11001894 [Bertholletia excelsa]
MEAPEPNLNKEEGEKMKRKSSGQKKRNREKGQQVDSSNVIQCHIEDKADKTKKTGKLLRKKKRKTEQNEAESGQIDGLRSEVKDGFDKHNGAYTEGENKDRKLNKKRRKTEKLKKAKSDKSVELDSISEDDFKEEKGKSRKASKKDHVTSKEEHKSQEKKIKAEQNEVYELSSGDEDCSRGMQKWITEYHQSRPGLKMLQQQIDDFITAYEEKEEQARREREALAAEGGWTVVVHHKGRKKTTDTETGVTVGSVAQAVVLENMAKKKSKEVGLDFYRFQKREVQKNEIMALQSKFEQDKKRIQQLRAARKFRPY